MGRRNKAQEKATLRDYVLYTDEGHIEVDTPEWFDWLETNNKFYISAIQGRPVGISLRVEVRNGTRYWYAYKRVVGTLHKRFVGQRPKWDDIRSLLERMVGTDFFKFKTPMPRFDNWK